MSESITYFAEELHPALDVRDSSIFIAFRGTKICEKVESTSVEKVIITIIGHEDIVKFDEISWDEDSTEIFLIDLKSRKYLVDFQKIPEAGKRWSFEKMENFKKNQQISADLLSRAAQFLEKYIDLYDETLYKLLAAWCIGTYLFPAFDAYPYLFVYGPKQSGKTHLLDCLENLCFNGYKIQNITRAAIGQMVSVNRATLLFDQAESIPKHMVSVLADSYKKGGGKRFISDRTKGNGGHREFSSYAPKAFAAIHELNFDLRDRCILLKLKTTTKRIPSLIGADADAEELRDGMYRFALLQYHRVREEYQKIQADGTRQGELWRPLEAVLRVLGSSEEEIESIREVFDQGTAETKNELSLQEEALFQAINDRVINGNEMKIANQTILEDVNKMLNESDQIKSGFVGTKLRQFDLYSERKRENNGNKKDTMYTFDIVKVQDAISRYKPNLDTGSKGETKVKAA